MGWGPRLNQKKKRAEHQCPSPPLPDCTCDGTCHLKLLPPQVPAASSSCHLKLQPPQVPASIASPWWGTLGVCPLSLGTQIIPSFPNLLSPFVTAMREVRNAAMAPSRLSPELSASSRMISWDCQGRQVPAAVPRGCSHQGRMLTAGQGRLGDDKNERLQD